MKLRVAQTRLGDPIHRRSWNDAAENAVHAITLIIGHDQQHVWRALGRHDGWWPIRLGVFRIFLDHASELWRLRRKLLAIDCHRSAGRPWRARDLLGREKARQSDEQARQTGG